MNDLLLILDSAAAAQQHFSNAAMMRTYRAVSEQHGPTQSLIDFINHDKSFGAEIGLEAFETFSTQAQHEIMLSKLDADAVEQLALENLSGTVNKFSNWLIGAGTAGLWGSMLTFIANPSKGKLIFAGVSYLALTSAALVKSGNAIMNGIYPHDKFMTFLHNLDEAISIEKDINAHLPHTFDRAAWVKFDEYWGDNYPIKGPSMFDQMNAVYGASTKGRVTVDVAGWTPENYKAAVTKAMDGVKRIHAEETKLAPTMQKIETWVAQAKASGKSEDVATAKVITDHIGHSARMFHESRQLATWLVTELGRVGKQFKPAE